MSSRLARLRLPAPVRGTDHGPFVRDLVAALAVRPHAISPMYFYDAAGSHLFDRICELPEYYPTRTELAILQCCAPEIARLAGPDAEIVEFGAGSLHKLRLQRPSATPFPQPTSTTFPRRNSYGS